MVVFWLAVAVGGLFAWNAVQIGFFNTWIMFSHLLLSVYLAIFLAPVMDNGVATGVATSWAYTLTLACIAFATLSISYGISFVCLSGRFRAEFTKTIDTVVAGIVGFLAGFLALSFVMFALCLSPLFQVSVCKAIGLDSLGQTTNMAYVCWWCDWLHMVVGEDTPRSSEDAVQLLVKKATAPAVPVANVNPLAPPPPPSPLATAAPQVVAGTQSQPKVAGVKGPDPQSKPAAAPQTAESVDPQRRPGESWEEEFARRHVIVTSPHDVVAAITKPPIKIVEVAGALNTREFGPKQVACLQKWASEGGVVWASNDVLDLFGINHSELVWWGGGLDCLASEGKTPLLAGCQRVVLNDAGGKAHALAASGAVPLLVLEKAIPFEDKAGTACWSLVPYGKGWISDTKAVDTTQYDGGQFWPNFCRFCLGRKPIADIAVAKAGVSVDKPMPATALGNGLSGTWQASNGAKSRIGDDGQTVTINGIAGSIFQSLTGTLARRDDDPGATVLTGRVDVVFAINAPKKYAIEMTATIHDSNSMRVRCVDWPVWSKKGKYLGTRPTADVWTRTESAHK